MELLRTLLLVYASILLISAIFSAVCWYFYRDKLYKYALCLWFATFLNALAEGLFQRPPAAAILGFSTYFLCSLILARILGFVTERRFPMTKYCAVMAATLVSSLLLDRSGAGFTVSALPVAIGIAIPMAHSSIATLLSKSDPTKRGTQVFCGLLLANSLHFLDYPFLRMNPAFTIPGFTLALALLMALAIFLPSFIIKNVSDRYSNTVSELNRRLIEHQQQMSDLMSLAQIGELSFGFVHDMASPTTLLLHYAKEISVLHSRGPQAGESLLPYSKGIEQATSRLVKLQRMFRAMIKNEGGSEPAPVELNKVAQSCVELFEPFLEKHGIAIRVEACPDEPVSVIESGVVERILLNLLQNAVNALAEHEHKEIEIRVDSRGEGFNVLSIRDSGPGIPPERLERLWEKFGHSDTGRRTPNGVRSGGSGFGLFKVKQLVESIHGAITVQTSSAGTEFRILIPKTRTAEFSRAV